MNHPSNIAAFLLAGAVFAPFLSAQLAPSPDAPPVSSIPSAAPEEPPAAAIKMNVSLVDLFFTVRDRAGNLVAHLTQDDCTVSEDHQPQRVKSFTAETSQPLTLGILLDTSSSQSRVFPQEQDAGSRFLERVLQAKDEAFLLSFDVNVDLLQDVTGNPQLLSRAIHKAEINSAGGNGAAGSPGAGGGTIPTSGAVKGTLLYDAVSLASRKIGRETGRKTMILLTDGQDQGSRAKIGEAIDAALRSNVILYVILIADRDFYAKLGYSGHSAMKKMTGETGGRLIDVGSNSKKLGAAFQQIEDELRTQYSATYTPNNTKLDGSFRHLAVDCHGDGLKPQLRSGYFAAAQQE
jgi:VWFA-related protein